MSAYLDLNETIDKKLAVFKEKYQKLRDIAISKDMETWELQRQKKLENQ